jgi:hypothetical protein
MTPFDESADAYKYNELLHARPLEEWHEDMGPKLWWKFPIEEPPYVGSPLDLGITVEAHVRLISQLDQDHEPEIVRRSLGGWPGYHTHFTDIAIPRVPK